MPANFVRGIQVGIAVLSELAEGMAPEELIAARRAELRGLVGPYDVVHLLGMVMFGETASHPDTYSESEDEGAAHVVELLAAELLHRKSRGGTMTHTPMIDSRTLDEVRRLTKEATQAEIFRRRGNTVKTGAPEEHARARAAGMHLTLRNPGWPWQEHETLRGLFGDTRFSSLLVEELGFDVEDGIACSDAMTRLIPERLHEHMGNAREAVERFDQNHPAWEWALSALGDEACRKIPADRRGAYVLPLWALNSIGDAFLVNAEALSERAEVERSRAAAFLSALSVPLGQHADDWFAGAEAVRDRPYIEVEGGSYLLSVPGNDLWALRQRFEATVKDASGYLRHRARWVEKRASELLGTALSPDEIHHSVEYSYRRDGGVIEGEIDVLVRCGDGALAVEAKSATMRPSARRGGEAFSKFLEENLSKAAEQGTRAAQALTAGAELRKDGVPLTLGSEIREAHPVMVSLDDLTAVAPIVWQLAGTPLVPEEVTPPWIVTLHELDLVSRTVQWPPQLFHFLRRRARLNDLRGFDAMDELDWWMHYLHFGLYFEEESDVDHVRVLSLTDPLDAWVLHEQGEREESAPIPRMELDNQSRELLATLCFERPPGWLPASCSFLEMAGEARARFWREWERLRQRAGERRKVQRMSLVFETGPEPMLVCGALVPDTNRQFTAPHLRQLVEEKLAEFGDQRVLGLASSVSSTRPYDALLVLERESWAPPPVAGGSDTTAGPRASAPTSASV